MSASKRLITLLLLTLAFSSVHAKDKAAPKDVEATNTVEQEKDSSTQETNTPDDSASPDESVAPDESAQEDTASNDETSSSDEDAQKKEGEKKKERIVEIKSARSTEYVKEDGSASEGPTEIVKFSGDVLIEVTEGAMTSKIGADDIIYNKSRDTLEAQGNVTYEHSAGKSGGEKFTGEALLFNIEKQEGVFLKGAMTQDSGKKKSDPYIVHAEVSGRDSSTTMAFKKGVLTTCDAEDPHWAIKASRIWLLPGNEIAILNGVFFIGPLPVFYIPFFFYPADEMIFHPVFGYRSREGYFVQTTTYLYGRKPLDTVKAGDENSFANFLQGDTLKNQERHGLFFKNLEEDASDSNPDFFKVMADGYSSLGAAVGIGGSFTTDSYLKSLSFNTMLGFSRTLYAPDTGIIYTTYDDEGERNYNKSWLFGKEMPFRYRSEMAMSIDKKPFSLNISLPLISDQEFNNDFQDRSETLNWFKLLTEHEKLSDETDKSDETSYSWSVSGSVSPDVSFANPWFTSASISNISTTLTFNSKKNDSLTGDELVYAPGKTFFYPEILKPSVKLSLGGTIFSTDEMKNRNRADKVDTGKITNPLKPKKDSDGKGDGAASATGSDETTEDTSTNSRASERNAEGSDSEKDSTDESEDDPIVKTEDFMPKGGTGLVPTAKLAKSSFSLKWSFTPTIMLENRYDPSLWTCPEDIDWNTFSSQYYQIDSVTKLMGAYDYDEDFLSVTSSLDFTKTKQEHTKLDGPNYDTDAEIETVNLADYKASVFALATTDGVKVIPFNRNPFLKPTSVSWDFTGDIVRNVFTGTAKEPTWEKETFEWDEDYIDKHSTTVVLGIAPGNYEQKLTFTSNLPPLLESYTGAANMSWMYGTVAMGTRLYEKSEDDKTWVWDPFTTVVSWTLPLGVTLGQEYAYDIEESDPSRLNLTGAVGPISLFYTLTNTVPYKLTDSGWMLDGTENKFIPSAMGCSFNNSSMPVKIYSWKNRFALQATLESNLKFDLVRLTQSTMDFKPKLTLKISDFLDLSFSSSSSNEVVARYFQQWMNLPEPLPGETNFFKDALNSFSFFDKEKREKSGFKLKSLTFSMTHYLHDWTATLDTTLEPKLKTTDGKPRYEFSPTVKFVVMWKPITDIKTTVKSEESVFTLNTTSQESDSSTSTTSTTSTTSN